MSIACARAYAHFVNSPAQLHAIHRPQTALWVWRRGAPVGVARYVERIRVCHRLALDVVVPSGDEACSRIRNALCESGVAPRPALDAWAADIDRLTTLFAAQAGAGSVRVRLESITEKRERLFHFDSIPLRLLCTYAGPGTQWLPEDNVDRAQLRLQGRSVGATNRAIVKDARRVRALRPWWVAVIKGESYPGNAGHGLVHRPPPARHDGATRVRLRIDPL